MARYHVDVLTRSGTLTHPCRNWPHVLVMARNLARDYPDSPVDAYDSYREGLRSDGSFWCGLSDDECAEVEEAVDVGRELARRKVGA